MLTTGGFPKPIERRVVADVVRDNGPAVVRGELELPFVGQALIVVARLKTAEGIVTLSSELFGCRWINIFVGVNAYPRPTHRVSMCSRSNASSAATMASISCRCSS